MWSPCHVSASSELLSIFLFFFSSRRRHTRWPRDWSSDVCSSDLSRRARDRCRQVGRPQQYRSRAPPNRSEERRVGKEGRHESTKTGKEKVEKLKTFPG